MKKRSRLSQFTLVGITLSLLINACSPNSPDDSVVVGSTPTPTASSGSSDNNASATAIPEEIASPIVPSPIQNIDPCSFFTAADAEPIVGTALIDVTPGSEIDEVTGGPLDYCIYKGDDVALVISFVKSNAAKDSQAWQDQLLNMAMATDSDATVTKTSDLGEQSYWGVTEHSAGWFVSKFPYVFALVVGGNIGYSEDYREDLKALAERVVNTLP